MLVEKFYIKINCVDIYLNMEVLLCIYDFISVYLQFYAIIYIAYKQVYCQCNIYAIC